MNREKGTLTLRSTNCLFNDIKESDEFKSHKFQMDFPVSEVFCNDELLYEY